MTLSPTVAATIAAQSAEPAAWLMPAGVAVGAATAMLIRVLRARRSERRGPRVSQAVAAESLETAPALE